MDRRTFLNLMASTGALASLPRCLPKDTETTPVGPPDASAPADATLSYVERPPRLTLTPYLVIPRLDVFQPSAPEWSDWEGAQWTDFDHGIHGIWFLPPAQGESIDVVVPVINLGNMSSRHLVVELYEGPKLDDMPLTQCSLRDRAGPLVLHPGRIMGVPMVYTRQQAEGAAVAVCYDPFFDPRHTIASVGKHAADRKSLGNCEGLVPPFYPGAA